MLFKNVCVLMLGNVLLKILVFYGILNKMYVCWYFDSLNFF